MAPRNGAVEHVAQYLMTAVHAARLAAFVFVEEAGGIGAHDGTDPEMAEGGQDRTVEVAHGRLHRGRLPRGGTPFHIFGGELRQRRAGRRKGRGFAVVPEAEHPGPRAVRLDWSDPPFGGQMK